MTRLAYGYAAERHPGRRDAILTAWVARQAHRVALYKAWLAAPWLHDPWLSAALCVHGKEGAWNDNTGNGYYGGMQFDLSTWASNGGTGMPNLQPPSVQLHVAWLTWLRRGWGPWPNTARACGLL